MSTSAKAVHFDDDSMRVDLDDGRRMAVPLAWFTRLLAATPEKRNQFELSPRGIHWDALDEDISIDGLLAGPGDRTHVRLVAPACCQAATQVGNSLRAARLERPD